MIKEERFEQERWNVGKTMQFADTFATGNLVSINELGAWFIENDFFDSPGVNHDDPDRTKNGAWHKYLQNRTAAIKLINRIALCDDYIIGEQRPAFQLNHKGNGDYEVLPYYDNAYVITRDYALKLTGYMENKKTAHVKLLKSAAFNLLTAAERETISRRQMLLEHSLKVAVNSIELLLTALDPAGNLIEG